LAGGILRVYVIGGDGYLYALNSKDGSELWKYNVGSDNSVPMVEDGVVYVKGGSYMYEIEGISGSLVRKINQVFLNPTVSDKKIYMPRALYGGVSVIDALTGDFLWAYGGSSICVSNPAVVEGTVYVGNESYVLSALDANSGAIKWQLRRDSDNGGGRSGPTFCNGIVYIVSYQNELFSLDANNGSLKWRKDFGGYYKISDPVAYNNMVYTSDVQTVYALDGTTGNEKWHFTNNLYDKSFRSCTYANSILYVGNTNGDIYAFNADNGGVKWHHKTDAGISTNICVLDGNKKAFQSGESGKQN
jgi:eukaryotic-like serine/threonine-protein kinase